jgi:hypothetical protein
MAWLTWILRVNGLRVRCSAISALEIPVHPGHRLPVPQRTRRPHRGRRPGRPLRRPHPVPRPVGSSRRVHRGHLGGHRATRAAPPALHARLSRPTANQAGDTAILTVIPTSGPGDTATEDLVRAVRDHDGGVPGAAIAVTGLTAINLDISAKLGSALVPYLTIVVGLAFILLMLVFLSLLVPIKATLGFLLSVAVTFGAVVTVPGPGREVVRG